MQKTLYQLQDDYHNHLCAKHKFYNYSLFVYTTSTVTTEGNDAFEFYIVETLPSGKVQCIQNYWLYNKSYKNNTTGKSKKGRIYRCGADLTTVSNTFLKSNDTDGCRYSSLCDFLRNASYCLLHPTTKKDSGLEYYS